MVTFNTMNLLLANVPVFDEALHGGKLLSLAYEVEVTDQPNTLSIQLLYQVCGE